MMKFSFPFMCTLMVLAVISSACVSRNELSISFRYQENRVSNARANDNQPTLWVSNHPRIRHFRTHYMKTRTVGKALERGKRYLPTIVKVFKEKQLPEELAYLPMLESLFSNWADSGSAKGMWQFTPQTAKHMGLKVGRVTDERLNWRKATEAAAEYLKDLGKRLDYNWALTLAAYNGGPNYMERRIKTQQTENFWRLRLRKETAEYVPRFVAMLQVAREKYPKMVAQCLALGCKEVFLGQQQVALVEKPVPFTFPWQRGSLIFPTRDSGGL